MKKALEQHRAYASSKFQQYDTKEVAGQVTKKI
jgi:hypothetical protein